MIDWNTVRVTPPAGWLLTHRKGESRASMACYLGDGEWSDAAGRTTVTHSTYLPPTHWAYLPEPPVMLLPGDVLVDPEPPANPPQPARWLVDIPGTDGVAMRDEAAARRLAERTDGATVRALYEAPLDLVAEQIIETLQDAHRALAVQSDSDLTHLSDDEERQHAPVQYAARKLMQALEGLAARTQPPDAAHEIERLREQLAAAEQRAERAEWLATCGCGDEFTRQHPGRCWVCASIESCEQPQDGGGNG